MDWIDSDWKSMFGGPCGFVWEKSGAGGLGIFITHSLAARRIEAQYQRNNRKYIRRLFFFTDLQVDSCARIDHENHLKNQSRLFLNLKTEAWLS